MIAINQGVFLSSNGFLTAALAIIKESFPPEQAYELERRFINSIKSSDPAKFTRGIRKLRDSKETARGLKIIEGNLKEED